MLFIVSYANRTCNPLVVPVGGTGFNALPLLQILSTKTVTLEYAVNFQQGFDWVLGGKLPGLYGGRIGCTGGTKALDCFSARFMWRAGGLAEVYLYVDKGLQTVDFCSKVPNSTCNPKYGASIGTGAFRFSNAGWVKVRETIQINSFKSDGSPNQDGILNVWVNDRSEPVIRIDSVVFAPMISAITVGIDFETFFGGSQPAFYNTKDQFSYFKDFKLYAF